MDSIFRHAVLDTLPNTIIVSFHGGNSDTSFLFYQGDSIYTKFPSHITNAYPDGIGEGFCYDTIYGIVDSLYKDFPETPVNIEISDKTWNPTTGIVDLSIDFRNDGPELVGPFWFNVIVTEDNITHMHQTQNGCSKANPPGPPYYDILYKNSWATRKMVFWSEGKSLIETLWPNQQTINQSVSFKLDTAWVPQNCNLVVNVYKKADSIYKSRVMQAIQLPVIGWTDISENIATDDEIILIYPNPVDKFANIHISLTNRGLCNLSIFDLNGNRVRTLLNESKSPGFYNIEMQANTLPKGTYVVVMKTNTVTTSEKIVIQ